MKKENRQENHSNGRTVKARERSTEALDLWSERGRKKLGEISSTRNEGF